MEHLIQVVYDRRLVRQALNKFMCRRLGWFAIALLGLLSLYLVAHAMLGTWDAVLTVILCGVLLMLALLVIVYVSRLRTSEDFFNKAAHNKVTFTFSESGVRVESDLGLSDLKWSAFDEILEFSDMWLLVYAKSGYLTLPTEYLSQACREFITNKISRKAVKKDRS